MLLGNMLLPRFNSDSTASPAELPLKKHGLRDMSCFVESDQSLRSGEKQAGKKQARQGCRTADIQDDCPAFDRDGISGGILSFSFKPHVRFAFGETERRRCLKEVRWST